MDRRTALTTIAGALTLVWMPRIASAQTDVLVAALRQGGHTIVFRHGATNPKQADTDPLRHQNIKKQRMLTDEGRALAREIGAALKSLGIPIAEVKTSKFYRAIETAKLMNVGKVEPTIDLTEGGLVVPPDENVRRAKAFRDLVAAPVAAGKNRLIVSHKPNIIDAFGKDWFEIKEGEASIFRIEAGKSTLVTRLQAAQWKNLKA